MNQHEENKFNMYNAVEAVFTSNATIVAQLPALAEVNTDLQSLIGQIEIRNSELVKVTEGKTSVKSKAMNELVAAIVPVASAVRAYCTKNNLLELRAIADFTENQLKHLSHVQLPVTVKNIKDGAEGILAQLANYGITEAKLALVDAKLAALKAASSKKDTGFTDHVALRETLYGLFDIADKLLKEEADDIVEVLKDTQPAFYSQYFAARVVKDLGGGRGGGENPEEPTPPPEEPK
ncbi:MAG: hypothetical protein WCS69_11645 [Ignavibacteriaceae bacterium]|jgi:hypothetical protein